MTHISTPTVGSLMTLGTIEPTQFEVYAQVDDTGGENVSERGFAYFQGGSGDPTTADSTVFQTGSFGVQGWSDFITGLTTNTSYQVRAYAINSAGTGYSATITVTTAFLLPPTVTNMVATTTGMTTASLSWDPDPSHAADTYDVRRERWDGSAWVDLTTIATGLTSPSHGDTGLTPGVLYRWSARGINSEGAGPWSDWDETQTDVQNGSITDAASMPVEFVDAGIFNPWDEATQFTGILDEFYEDTTIIDPSTYRYRVWEAVDGVPVFQPSPWSIVYTQVFGTITDSVRARDLAVLRSYPIIMDVIPMPSDDMPGLVKRPVETPTLRIPEVRAASDGRHFAWDYNTSNFVEQEAVAFRRTRIEEGAYSFGGLWDEEWLPAGIVGNSIGGVVQSPDGTLIAVNVAPPADGSDPDLRVVFLDGRTRAVVAKFYSTTGAGREPSFSPDGNWYSRGNAKDGIINVNTFDVVDLNRVNLGQSSSAFSPDSSKYLVFAGSETSSTDAFLRLYEVGTWDLLESIARPSGSQPTSCNMRWSPNGSWLVLGHTLADAVDPNETSQPCFSVYATNNWSIAAQPYDYQVQFNEYFTPSFVGFDTAGDLVVCLNAGLENANRELRRYTGGNWNFIEDIDLEPVSPRHVAFSKDGNWVSWPTGAGADATIRPTSNWSNINRLITVGQTHHPAFIEDDQSGPQGLFIGKVPVTDSPTEWRLVLAPTAKTVIAEEWWDGSSWSSTEVWIPTSQEFLFFPLSAWTEPSYLWSVATREVATELESNYASNRLFRLDQTYALVVVAYGFDAGLMPSDHVVANLEEPAEPTVGEITDAAPLAVDLVSGSMLVQGDITDIGLIDPDVGIFAVPPTLIAPAEDALVDGALDVDFTWEFNTDNADTQAEYALWVEGEGWWNGSTFVDNQVWVVSSVETVTIPPSVWSASP